MATRKKAKAPVEGKPVVQEPETRNAATAIRVVIVRKEPDDESLIMTMIKGRGTPLQIKEETDGWCRMANGLGWIRKEYIEYI